MAQWEYCKIDLGMTARQSTDVDLLNDLGTEGWELVNIMPNGIAFLKRPLPLSAPSKSLRRAKQAATQVEKA